MPPKFKQSLKLVIDFNKGPRAFGSFHTSFNKPSKISFILIIIISSSKMPGTAEKHKKREAYRSSLRADMSSTAMPRKKFYRQRAHANPFSDHKLM